MAVSPLSGKKLILGVTGSIAAYKSAELVRQLIKAGADVRVIMTPAATRFIPALTLRTVSRHPVFIDLFDDQDEDAWTQHIDLGLWADLFIVAPATAQTIAKLAHGFCDSMLTAAALAARCPMLVCPAMDHDMFVHPAMQDNLAILAQRGVAILNPAEGELASGLIGKGRLPEPDVILDAIAHQLDAAKPDAIPQSLTGKHVLVSAGPTRERIDPVRFLSNPSTGTMGFALAEAAQKRGARVTLVAGPVALETPAGVERIDVGSAQEMHAAVMEHAAADVVFMAAAVADYTPAQTSDQKLKKGSGDMHLTLTRTPDILAELGEKKRAGQLLIGFALETQNGLKNAQSKLGRKNLDWIVLNSPNEPGEGFGTRTNKVTIIPREGTPHPLSKMPKQEVAAAILDHIIVD